MIGGKSGARNCCMSSFPLPVTGEVRWLLQVTELGTVFGKESLAWSLGMRDEMLIRKEVDLIQIW